MSGFGGFGTGTSGGLFGAKPPDQATSGFTLPTTTTTTGTTALTFGTPTFGTSTFGSGGTGLFGAAPQQQQQPQQAPTFGTGFGVKPGTLPTITTAAAPTGFTFGALTANTTLPSFGSFGTSSTPTFGATPLNLGVARTTATAAVTGFTVPATTTTASIAAPAPALAPAPAPAPMAPTFNFGLTSAVTTSAPLTFSLATTTAATTAAPTLTFGVSAAGTPATTTTPTTQPTGFTLGQPATTNALSFGLPKTTGGLTFGTTTTGFGTVAFTTAPTFNLGTATTTTSTFNLGTTTTTTTLTTGLFGTPKTTENLSITTTTATTVGLGGVNNAQTTQGLSGLGTLEPKQAKDHVLPDLILQTLNDFQNFTKQQKSISVEISHGSSKPLKKVQEDTEAMESLLTMITSGLTRNAIAVDKLKTETAQGLHQAETAQRNHETPPGLEYDNSAPADYFNDLVTKFETDTVRLRVQIEASEKHLRSLTQSSTISPQELTLAMRRLHETLIVLAARVQALHTTVQSQKEQYKNLRRVYFKDDTNIFDNEVDQTRVKKQTVYSLRSLTGPTPFSDTPGVGPPLCVDGLAMLANSTGVSMPATSTNPSWMSPLQGTGNTGSILPTSNLLGGFQPGELQGFQLSKPPTGNKRSRR